MNTETGREEKIKLLTRLFGYFRGAVINSFPARHYITQVRRLALFLEIGYNLVQFHHGTRKDADLIGQCIRYGCSPPTGSKTKTGAETGYSVFGKNCIVFPLKDQKEQITGLYFRSIREHTENKLHRAIAGKPAMVIRSSMTTGLMLQERMP